MPAGLRADPYAERTWGVLKTAHGAWAAPAKALPCSATPYCTLLSERMLFTWQRGSQNGGYWSHN